MFKDIFRVIAHVKRLSETHCIVLLTGKMGMGKTFFVREYMKQVHDFTEVNSPTYATCNTYVINGNYVIKHFDFYIKNNDQELLIALEAADLIFIEWWSDIPGQTCIEVNCETEQVNILKFD